MQTLYNTETAKTLPNFNSESEKQNDHSIFSNIGSHNIPESFKKLTNFS